jgi:hypothetical protein
MPHLSLRQASQQFAVSRQTLGKALENGVVSGAKDDRGNWQIDSAELIRVYKPRPQSGRTRPPAFTTVAMPKDGLGQAAETVPDDSAATIARLKAELAAEKELRAVERELLQRHLDDVRRLLPAPDLPRRRRWWPW